VWQTGPWYQLYAGLPSDRAEEIVMEFELKRLSAEGVAAAIKQADHYRLLNQPRQAESICLDVLESDPSHQQAQILLLLSRTDQFGRAPGVTREQARETLEHIHGEYEKTYYAGLICERWAKAQLARAHPGSGSSTYDGLREAMEWYEKAETLRPAGNDDPLLRWNSCARLIMRHDHIVPAGDDDFHPFLE
jgi:hypothetical protein